MKLTATQLEECKKVIRDYSRYEFGSEPSFEDLHDIGLAYTTLTDDEIEIQVSLDLIDLRLNTWIGAPVNRLVESIDFGYDEIISNAWSFDSLIEGWQTWLEDNGYLEPEEEDPDLAPAWEPIDIAMTLTWDEACTLLGAVTRDIAAAEKDGDAHDRLDPIRWKLYFALKEGLKG